MNWTDISKSCKIGIYVRKQKKKKERRGETRKGEN